MAAFDYSDLRDTVVQPLLKDFGKDAVLLMPGVTVGPAYDPQPGADIEQPVTVVATKITAEDTVGTNVQMTDEAYLVSSEGVLVDPKLVDRIRIGGQVLQVILIKSLKPGPVLMLWKVFVRR